MQEAKNGDTVRVHYHGKLTDGTTFDSSEGRDPLEFTVGAGQVIKGFDNALAGMKPGDKKTVHIPVDEAYGPKHPENIVEFPKSNFPPDITPEIGMQLGMNDDQGNNFPVTVTEIKDDVVVLDANHSLAGQDLVFDIELVSIN